MFTFETVVRLLIVSMASYRVARMIATERGPFDLFIDFRSAIINRAGNRSWIVEGVTCPLCVGFYVSALFLGLSYLDYAVYLVDWLAVAGLQTAIQKQER